MQKTVDAMAARGTPFKGILYGGFMATKDGPKLLEYNVRFADPESMNVLPIYQDDFLETCRRLTDGRLPASLGFARQATVCKYVVPMGYGSHPKAGEKLKVDEDSIRQTGAKLFFASVDEKGGHLYTTTSRSLAIVGIAANLEEAESISEEALAFVAGSFYARRDIGKPEVVRSKVERMRKIHGNS
jgi:phosphoribosylamine--glycine ligase